MKSMTMMRILEMATLNFFPTEGNWVSSCFKRPNDLNMHNLPCHLRDDAWLASMLMKDQELDYIEYNEVLNFIKTNNYFNDKRHEYEQRIVEWQINWMINGGENWLADLEYGGDLVFLSSSCDIGFRKGIVDTLTKIGIDLNITPDPRILTVNRQLVVYAKNDANNKYYNTAKDEYDLDNDGNVDEIVGMETKKMMLVGPATIATMEIASNYNKTGDITDTAVGPEIVYIDKDYNDKTATVSANIANNYSGNVSSIVILGRTPFEGNTSLINKNRNLGSEYTAEMISAFDIPKELEDYVTVYYSTNEEIDQEDLFGPNNNWKTEEEIEDFSLVRNYYNGSKAAILVYDITDRDSFNEVVNYWYNEVKTNMQNISKYFFIEKY